MPVISCKRIPFWISFVALGRSLAPFRDINNGTMSQPSDLRPHMVPVPGRPYADSSGVVSIRTRAKVSPPVPGEPSSKGALSIRAGRSPRELSSIRLARVTIQLFHVLFELFPFIFLAALPITNRLVLFLVIQPFFRVHCGSLCDGVSNVLMWYPRV